MESEGAGEAAEAGDGAASGPIYLYKVIDREAVPREKVKALWRAGHVSGLFNLPTEELFNACRDFGVKVKVDVKGLMKAKEDGAVLQSKLKTLIERSVDKERELFELKTKVADLSQANLVQEEQFKRRLNELTTRNKALAKERKRTNKEKTEAKDENLRLKAELERVRKQLEEARERERQNRERDREREMERERERERERKGKAKREQEDAEEAEAEARADADRQRRKQMAAATASDEDSERAKQLQVELKRERELLKQMAVENQKLTSRIQQLMIENEEMKLSSSITQTDHLNRKLLMSFMSTMDSLRRLEDDDDHDDDDGGRDGEGEWEAHHGDGFDGYLDDDNDAISAVDGNGTGSSRTREWITTTPADEERQEAEERDKEAKEEQALHKAPWGE